MSSKLYGKKLKELYPVVEPNLSDSGAVDCVLEFLVMVGQRSLPEVSTHQYTVFPSSRVLMESD